MVPPKDKSSGALSDVVWGNQAAIDQRLKRMGKSRELTQWFADWKDMPIPLSDHQGITDHE
jgi:hypothetical protein